MWTVIGLCLLLALAGAEVQIYGEASHMSRHSARRPQRTKSSSKTSVHRSLDLEALTLQASPSTSRSSLPAVVRLFPPTSKPAPLPLNMPLRFGRTNTVQDLDNSGPVNPNLPMRFGRDNANLPMRFGRDNAHLPMRFGRDNSNLPMRFGRDNSNLPMRFGRDNSNLPMRFGRDNSNLPMRFGRDNSNLPMRFGRDNSNLPMRFGRDNSNLALRFGREQRTIRQMWRDGFYWSLIRTILSY
uniref:Uncharacterized protein n=1 Tax=Knipowitschia caucasica TaxID=637954 RepID=A0AAV2K9G9_KNICA